MHALLREKGFERKNDEELAEHRKKMAQQKEEALARSRRHMELLEKHQKRREEYKQRRQDEREYLGPVALLPSYGTMFSLYSLALGSVCFVCFCVRIRRR